MDPRIGHRELLSLHQNRLEHHQVNLNELTTNALRNPLREHLDISGFDIKNARRIHTSNSLQVGTTVTVGNSIIINQNIALGGNITDLDGNVLTFGGGSLDNLTDTNITTPITNGSSLVYNTSNGKWENTLLQDIDTLENLTDTNISNKQDQDFLLYDSLTGKWLNTPSNLENHKDITITSVGDNEVLKYNSTSGKWENEPARLIECGDTNISNLQNNQVLKYNSTSGKWENTERIDSLNELGDVNINTETNNQVLKYNNSSSNWENTFVNLTELNDTNLPSLNDRDTLRYDNATGKWLAEALNLNNIDDVNITSVANDEVLKYNSSSGKWENSSSGTLFPNAGSTDEVKNGRGDITTGTTITEIRNNNSTLDDVVAKMLELEAPLEVIPTTTGLSFTWTTGNTQIKLDSNYTGHTARFNRGSWNNAYDITGTTLDTNSKGQNPPSSVTFTYSATFGISPQTISHGQTITQTSPSSVDFTKSGLTGTFDTWTASNGTNYQITTSMTSVSSPTITVYSKTPFANSYTNTTNSYSTITLTYYVYKPLFVNSAEITSSYTGTSTAANSGLPVTFKIYTNTNDVIVPDHTYNYVVAVPFNPTNVYIYDSAFTNSWIAENTNDWSASATSYPTTSYLLPSQTTSGDYYLVTLTRNRTSGDIKISR